MTTYTILINGVDHIITIDGNNLHIENSCIVPKSWFDYTLSLVENMSPVSDVWKRSKASLKREWATHNMLYALGMWKNRTKDVDLNYPQRWYMKVAYSLIGTIAFLFIK